MININFKKTELKNFHLIWFWILVSIYFGLGFFLANKVGVVGDETAHLSAAHGISQGFGLNYEHPSLVKFFNSLLINLFFDGYPSSDTDQWSRSLDFLLNSRYNKEKIIFSSRLVYLFFNSQIFIWIYYFCFKKKFLSPFLSLIFLTILVFSPSFFSHNYLLTFDVAASITALAFIINLAYINKYWQNLNNLEFLFFSFLTGFSLFFAVNTKFSNLILVFIFLVFIFCKLINLNVKKINWPEQLLKLIYLSSIIFWLNLVLIFLLYSYSFWNIIFVTKNPWFNFWIRILSPFYFYFKGAWLTLGRSNDPHFNFFDGEFVISSYQEFVFRVFWFKETPAFLISLSFGTFGLIYFILKKKSYLNLNLKNLIWAAYPLIYFWLAKNSEFTIGYRHFYPVLIFIYFATAFGLTQLYKLKVSNLWLKFTKKFLVLALVLFLGFFLFQGYSQNLTYVNALWKKPKWMLANDSTINWDQDLAGALVYFRQQNLFNSQQNPETGQDWNLALNISNGPNTRLYLTEIFGNEFRLQNFSEAFVDLKKTKLKETKYEYLIIDSTHRQVLEAEKINNQIAKQNLNLLDSSQIIYKKNDVVWIYRL